MAVMTSWREWNAQSSAPAWERRVVQTAALSGFMRVVCATPRRHSVTFRRRARSSAGQRGGSARQGRGGEVEPTRRRHSRRIVDWPRSTVSEVPGPTLAVGETRVCRGTRVGPAGGRPVTDRQQNDDGRRRQRPMTADVIITAGRHVQETENVTDLWRKT